LGGKIFLSGAATLGATSTTYATANNDNVTVSLLHISVLNVSSNLGGSTTSGVADGGHLTAASLSATSNGTATSSASTHFIGVALGAGSGSGTTSKLTQTTDARIGDNAMVNLGSGDANLTATGMATSTATDDAVSVSGVDVSFMTISASTGAAVHAFVGDG